EDRPLKIKTKDGLSKWISIKIYEKLDLNGNVTHFQGLIIDVTSEIIALNKLSESKLHYQNLIENNIASIMIKTSQNNIVMTNKRARELFGLTNTQLEGIEELPSTWKVFNTYGDEIGLAQMPSNRIFETRDKVFNEIIGILHSNTDEIIWILVNAYAEFDKKGNIQRVISSSIDISEIKKAENKINSLNSELEVRVKNRTRELTRSKKELQKTVDTLQQAQEQLVQNEKMASLGNLVAGVAHEINTPVGSSLTGITHLVTETINLEKLYKADEMSQEEFEDYLSTLKEIGTSITISLQQAASLIKSFKQVAVDQSHSELRDFFVKQYIDEILLSIKTKIRETKIRVEVSCLETIMTRSYPGAFSQVITNLVLNSLLHAYEKNDVGLITIEVQEEDEDLKIIYKDDGKGISEVNLKKIYEPFFTTKRSEGGSGLGMHIIYNIVMSNLNGRINCISKEGSGVTFIIYMKKDLGLIS
ncbi:MAG: PAS domain S-box protein, partial [Campylobacteraceae bacterium]|nr:PAS domain S-box protein [Campylobacteraceae bacterium]